MAQSEIESILRLALENGIQTIDSAVSFGESEIALGLA